MRVTDLEKPLTLILLSPYFFRLLSRDEIIAFVNCDIRANSKRAKVEKWYIQIFLLSFLFCFFSRIGNIRLK